jgi:hypothetical protein
MAVSTSSLAQNMPVIHLVNGAGQKVSTTLNAGSVFITDFKGHNDVTITKLASFVDTDYLENFGGIYATGNPSYVTNFIGTTNTGTGNGTAGAINAIQTTGDLSLQFDFAIQLGPTDRVLIMDCDKDEQYQLQAFVKNGSVFTKVSLDNWGAQNFPGMTQQTPDFNFPLWDAATGVLSSQTYGENLAEPLMVITPDQKVDRIIFTQIVGGSPGQHLFCTASIQCIQATSNPIITRMTNAVINEKTAWNYTPTVNDTNYTFGLSNAPSGMTINKTTGAISWQPTESQGPGTNQNITYIVYSSGLAVASTNFNVVVNEINTAPELYVPVFQTLHDGATLIVTNIATDSDVPANTLTFNLVSAPSGVTLDPNTGVLTWTPTSAQVGTSTITLKVTDFNPWAKTSQRLSVTNSFDVVVESIATPPTWILQPSNQVVSVGQGFNFISQATGVPTPTFRWQFSADGVNYGDIAGATESSYHIDSSSPTNIGYYRVVASNPAQTNTSTVVSLTLLSVKMYAGVNIYGPLGANYLVQSIPVVNGTNWTTLTNISLPSQPYIYIDYSSPTNACQFYRVSPLP